MLQVSSATDLLEVPHAPRLRRLHHRFRRPCRPCRRRRRLRLRIVSGVPAPNSQYPRLAPGGVVCDGPPRGAARAAPPSSSSSLSSSLSSLSTSSSFCAPQDCLGGASPELTVSPTCSRRCRLRRASSRCRARRASIVFIIVVVVLVVLVDVVVVLCASGLSRGCQPRTHSIPRRTS